MRLVLDLRWVKSPVLDGIARVSLSLTAALMRQQPDWFFVLLFGSDSLRRFGLDWLNAADTQAIQADYVSLVIPFGPASPLNQLRLGGLLRKHRPEQYFSFYYAFQRLSIPQTIMVHDLIPLLFPDSFKQASLGFRLSMTRADSLKLLLSNARRVVTVSHSTRQDLEQQLQVPKSRIAVCYPGVSPSLPVKGSYPGLAPGYVLALGRPDPHKNLAGLIAAYAALPDALRQQHPLVLAGPEDSRYTPALRQQIQDLGLGETARILGPVAPEHLPALYSGARLLAMVSHYEGFGLPVIEAMSYGVPVLAAWRGSLPEVAGEAALLVNPERPPEITWGLHRLLTKVWLHKNLIKRGREQAARFSWAASASRLAEILQQPD